MVICGRSVGLWISKMRMQVFAGEFHSLYLVNTLWCPGDIEHFTSSNVILLAHTMWTMKIYQPQRKSRIKRSLAHFATSFVLIYAVLISKLRWANHKDNLFPA
ncbi:uncharacterized protein ASPGLDRAFT_1460804 [Aspergillus glaucus CBS 516.65]|uniref:Uncharacterized protein n=1 Tax=Aspergillus glaucus CBS 516.65 TaxID=1160497 RepID=A0A1L9VL51_ASPGL|nr:hypothetical protein ASPGLDRAFT_1460804 [Aspergillus glaucus CBS 516.65]OJJ84657.1 hypothetical protein ASPGLDRAFT_1460804 [Aspergillus glaucus CBS 516.65]